MYKGAIASIWTIDIPYEGWQAYDSCYLEYWESVCKNWNFKNKKKYFNIFNKNVFKYISLLGTGINLLIIKGTKTRQVKQWQRKKRRKSIIYLIRACTGELNLMHCMWSNHSSF